MSYNISIYFSVPKFFIYLENYFSVFNWFKVKTKMTWFLSYFHQLHFQTTETTYQYTSVTKQSAYVFAHLYMQGSDQNFLQPESCTRSVFFSVYLINKYHWHSVNFKSKFRFIHTKIFLNQKYLARMLKISAWNSVNIKHNIYPIEGFILKILRSSKQWLFRKRKNICFTI